MSVIGLWRCPDMMGKLLWTLHILGPILTSCLYESRGMPPPKPAEWLCGKVGQATPELGPASLADLYGGELQVALLAKGAALSTVLLFNRKKNHTLYCLTGHHAHRPAVHLDHAVVWGAQFALHAQMHVETRAIFNTHQAHSYISTWALSKDNTNINTQFMSLRDKGRVLGSG